MVKRLGDKMRIVRSTTIKEKTNTTKRNQGYQPMESKIKTNDNPPHGGTSVEKPGIKVSITDMEIFKDAIETLIELIKDKRISEDIRYEYLDKLMQLVNINNYHIDL